MHYFYPILPTIKFLRFKIFVCSLFLLLATNMAYAQENPCQDECSASYTLTLPSTIALCGAQPCPPTTNNAECEILGFAFTIDTIILENGNKRTLTTWTAVDWCRAGLDSGQVANPLVLPYLLVDESTGEVYDFLIENDSVFFSHGDERIYYAPYTGIFTIASDEIAVLKNVLIEVFSDANKNCAKDTPENGLADWQVRLISQPSGREITLKTDQDGQIDESIFVPETDETIEVFVLSALNNNEECTTVVEIPVKEEGTAAAKISLPVALQSDCQLLTVDLATPFLRRCFSNTYTVHYCNYSDQEVTNGQVGLKLDDYLTIESSEISYEIDENGIYFFDLATIPAGFCDDFHFQVLVSCDAQLGQTHCSEAQIFPNEICDPVDPNWTGASIDLEGNCDQDSVRFKIKNVGDGDMLKESGFIVTEDVLMLRNGAFQLQAGEETEVVLAATGATYHLLAQQEDFHPSSTEIVEFVEGCGGYSVVGLPNALRASKADVFRSKDCQENIGAYDPNDKAAVPSGIGSENFLKKNTDITYKIRFQNTGTDTAFNVVILDTLSNQLDASSVIPGASSHDYQFQILRDSLTDAAILRFAFENIMLPDSFVNEPASNGFVQFLIAQQPDLEDGIILENSAAIYFDFNEPVITNTVFHTIGMPLGRFVTSIPTQFVPQRSVKIQPNPFSENAMLYIAGEPIKQGMFTMFDAQGKAVQRQIFSGNELNIQQNNLPSGFYFYSISVDNQLIKTGKIQINQK